MPGAKLGRVKLPSTYHNTSAQEYKSNSHDVIPREKPSGLNGEGLSHTRTGGVGTNYAQQEAMLPYFDPTKCSTRKNGRVKAYAANTN